MASQRSYIFVVFFTVALFLSGASSAFAATIYANASTGNDTTGDGTIGTPYKTFHKAYTSASSGDTINLTGTFTWTDADETGDSATTGYTLGKNIIIQGQNAADTILQAASSDNTASARVFTISSGVQATTTNVTIRYGKVTNNYGGCISSAGILTVLRSEVHSCRSQTWGYFGGGVYATATTTIDSSTIHGNYTSQGGGGIAFAAAGNMLTVTNSTIYNNTREATTGNTEGAGIYVMTGSAKLTNSSIVANRGNQGHTGFSMNDPNGTTYLRNMLIAGNINYGTGTNYQYGYRSSGQGNTADGGYNVIGGSNYWYTFATSTNWTDTNNDGTFAYVGNTSITGSASLDTGLSFNDNTDSKVRTIAILAGSIAINNGTTTAHASVSIPTADQRGASRSGATDVGAYEYNGGGLTVAAPTTQASSVTFSSVQYKQMTVSWTNGNGARQVAFMKAANTGTANPVDGTQYSGNSVFGSGDQIGSSGWYAIYDGHAGTVAVTGLTQATDYIVQVFSYNGVSANASVYNTSSASGNPATQASYTPTTVYANSSTGNDTSGSGSSGSPYRTFHKAYTVSNQGDTINLTGTFTWTDAAETGDSATTGYTLGKDLTITGQGADQTIVQATSTDNTADRRVFTVSSGKTVTISNLVMQYGKVSSNDGGCVNSAAILTLTNVEVYSCRSQTYGYHGGGIYATATTTITGSTLHGSYTSQSGGGITFVAAGSLLTVTNSTIYNNTREATTGNTEGAGIYVMTGSAKLTNSTISANRGNGGQLGYSMNDSSGTTHLRNMLIAGNVSYGSQFNIYQYGYRSSGQGNTADGGYNVIGGSNYWYTFATSTNWTDTNNDGTFAYVGNTAITGTANLDTSLSLNASVNGTKTLALLAGSIAINNATTTAHASVSIPTADQRGASRSGATDVGAYEYGGGGLDSNVPTVSLTLPADGATIYGSAIGITATASDDTAVAGVKFYVNNILVGSEDITSPYAIVWNSLTATTSGSKTVVAVARDSAGNVATSSARTVTLSNQPAPSSVIASTSASAATITWATPVEGSSRMFFGFVNGLASSTPEANTGTRVSSHSVNLSGLPPCSVYKYYTVSKNEASEIATSTQSTFKTAGCSGGATITANSEGDITAVGGGTLTEGALSLTVPTSFTATSSQATFQAKKLDGATFFANVTGPSGKNRAGTTVYNLSAYTDTSTTLSTFSAPLTVTLSYSDSDVSGLDESTLKIHRYDSSAWSALSSCTVNTSANTVSCTTTAFSDFGIFGDSSPSSSSSSSVGGGVVMGCTDRNALNYSKYAFGTNTAPCQYANVAPQSIETTKEQFVPSTKLWVNRDLWVKDEGDDVRALQNMLIARGYTIPAGATGYFGQQTESALAEFQKANGISPAIGYFGPKTRSLVNSTGTSVAPETGATEPASPSTSTSTPEAITPNSTSTTFSHSTSTDLAPSTKLGVNRDLWLKDEGTDVVALQTFLIQKGYTLRSGATGYFGEQTREALAVFQEANGIAPASGYFGALTRAFVASVND